MAARINGTSLTLTVDRPEDLQRFWRPAVNGQLFHSFSIGPQPTIEA
jgi:hypothetical protein